MAQDVHPFIIRYTDFTLDTIFLSREDGYKLHQEIDDHDAEADILVLKKPPAFDLSQANLFGRRST